MKNKKALVGTLLSVLVSGNAVAGVYTDELTKCLVSSTTKEDRVELVKWMFLAVSAHPAVDKVSAVTPSQMDESNKKVAKLSMRLTTEACLEQTKDAIAYEGDVALEKSFQILGEVAGKEMFSHPEVIKSMAGLDKHLDSQRVMALLKL
ncbi:hypothetical protein BCU90_03950 [Vibrio lentus]|uniref:hypothetical protein n=1 Tax=Vibrio lentus TaxID=136468 RepID=UPI000C838821|nr:hypothetical protein [Vibrio lentus]PMG47315.1 hypothetical protein BCU90_03950 [Vibrio lentus]